MSRRISTPTIIWTGTEHAVVWVDDSDGTVRVRFARVAKDLTRIGGVAVGPEASDRDCGPSIAWTGSGFGVAWLDVEHEEGSVRFARFDAEGRWIGPAETIEGRPTVYRGDKFYAAGPCIASPAIVWAGGGFGIAWGDRRDGGTIRFRRLDAEGVPVGGELTFRPLEAAGAQGVRDPVLTWDGLRYGLAWVEDQVGQDGIVFVAIDDHGTLAGDPIRVASDNVSDDDGSLAMVLADRASFLVWAGSSGLPQSVDADVYRDARIRIARIGANGVELGPVEPPPTPAAGSGPGTARQSPDGRWTGPRPWFQPLGVASADDRLAVVWTHFISSGPYEFGTADLDGLFVQKKSATAPLTSGTGSPPPSLVWNGTDWVAAWRDGAVTNGTIRLGRFAADGSRFDEAVMPIAGLPRDRGSVGFAAAGNDFGLVWSDALEGRPQLIYARVNARGDLVTPPTIVPDTSGAASATLVWNGQEFAAAWVDDRNSAARSSMEGRRAGGVYFARLDLQGRPVEGSAQVADGHASSPRVAWTGDGYGLVWSEWQNPCDTVKQTVDPDTGGTVEECIGPYDAHRIRFARLDRDGRRVGDEVLLEPPLGDHPPNAVTALKPAVTWTGDGFIVSMVGEFRPHLVCNCDAEYTGWLVRLDTNGQPRSEFEPVPIDSNPFPNHAVLVSRGDSFATGWSERPDGGDRERISATVIGPSGVRRRAILHLAGEREHPSGPALAACGRGYVAAWFVDRWKAPPGELNVVGLDRDGQQSWKRVTWSIDDPNIQSGPVMASAEGICGIAWMRYGRYGKDPLTIYFAAVQCY